MKVKIVTPKPYIRIIVDGLMGLDYELSEIARELGYVYEGDVVISKRSYDKSISEVIILNNERNKVILQSICNKLNVDLDIVKDMNIHLFDKMDGEIWKKEL